jgi:hypothetical protein
MPSETVDAFLRQWLAGKDGNTARRYGGTIKNFLEHINGKKHAALVSHQDILGSWIADPKRASLLRPLVWTSERWVLLLTSPGG